MENEPTRQNSPSVAKHSLKHNLNNGVGVTKLMQQCTSMLREKMWNDNHQRPAPAALRYRESNGSLQPDNALEAMGPVLESVLANLTQEYERRLLLKDNEIKHYSEQLKRTQEHVQQLEQQLTVTSGTPQIEYKVSEEEQKEMDRLKKMELALIEQVEDRKQENMMINQEYERVRQQNLHLEVTCKTYQEKCLANESILQNFKQVADENRKLYNMVQDLRGNIRVFCRVRPIGTTGDETPSCVAYGDEGQLAVYNPANSRRTIFGFDKSFAESTTQEQVYIETQPLIRSVLDGYNVCIFAYGQTGSGKTHTMSGTNIEQISGRGINYRALDDLFDLQHQRQSQYQYEIKVQMLEVYNEKVRDLLAEDRGVRLEIQNTKVSGTNVPEAIHVEVSSTQDVLDVMATGQSNRATADTKMNERSSRSHSVLTVIVKGYNNVTQTYSHGCLHLVDLAGSERVGRSEATGERLEEAKCINKSLSAIGDVMSALASKSKHIPFRNSKLTQLLSDSLSGQAKVMMFMHIAPESSSYQESLSTLKFGSRVSEITLGQAKRNVETGSSLDAKEASREMQAKVMHLTEDLKSKDASIKSLNDEVLRAKAERMAEQRRAEALEARLVDNNANSRGLNSESSVTSGASSGNASRRRTPRPVHGSIGTATTPTMAAAGPVTGGSMGRGSTERGSAVRSSTGSGSRPGSGGGAPPSAGGGSMTPEEKHIQRMRVVMAKREAASGLPSRPRTAIGATSPTSTSKPVRSLSSAGRAKRS